MTPAPGCLVIKARHMKAPIDFEPVSDTYDLTLLDARDPEDLREGCTYDEASGPSLRRGRSIFDRFPWPKQVEEKQPPLPCVVFTRTQVLLYNLKAAGYDLS